MTASTALAEQLAAARDELLAAIEGISRVELIRRPPGEPTADDEHWPVCDVLWHVGAYEDFIRRTIDGARRGVAARAYGPPRRPAHMETPELLRAWLDQTRRPTVVLLEKLTSDELAATRVGANGRETTFTRLLERLAAHDGAHAAQVRALRADGAATGATNEGAAGDGHT